MNNNMTIRKPCFHPNAAGTLLTSCCFGCGDRREQFVQWAESLSEQQTPSWLGLPNNAEKVLLTTLGGDMTRNLLKMQLLEDDDELAYTATTSSDDESEQQQKKLEDGRPAWMRTLSQSLTTWLKLLPKVRAWLTTWLKLLSETQAAGISIHTGVLILGSTSCSKLLSK